MRAFIAIDISDSLKTKISKIQNDLKICNLNCRWVAPYNIHITLKFLECVKEEKIELIKEALSQTASTLKPFEIVTTDFGFFPNNKKPKILFIETSHQEQIKTIFYRLEEKLDSTDFQKNTKFKSHITLARIKTLDNIEYFKERLKTLEIHEKISISAITLYKSTLTSTGPIYEKILKSNLTV